MKKRVRYRAATRKKPPVCSKCSERGFRFRGERWLCVVHHRIDTMQNAARVAGKYVPSLDELWKMCQLLIAREMKCEACGVTMHWSGSSRGKTVSLQHDRSGAIRLICVRCNSRHDDLPGDTFYDVPPDCWRCPRCKEVKPLTEFYAGRGRCGSLCKPCRKTVNREMWKRHGKRWTQNSIRKKEAAK